MPREPNLRRRGRRSRCGSGDEPSLSGSLAQVQRHAFSLSYFPRRLIFQRGLVCALENCVRKSYPCRPKNCAAARVVWGERSVHTTVACFTQREREPIKSKTNRRGRGVMRIGLRYACKASMGESAAGGYREVGRGKAVTSRRMSMRESWRAVMRASTRQRRWRALPGRPLLVPLHPLATRPRSQTRWCSWSESGTARSAPIGRRSSGRWGGPGRTSLRSRRRSSSRSRTRRC